MKRFTRWYFPAALIAALLLFLTPGKVMAQYDGYGDASYQDFYDALSPYGEWIDDPEYGYVWRPDAGADFQPYSSNGYWAMTDYGNTWVSNYAWGWAPFHYGRWTRSYSGWCWIPGTEWGPAWVTWRSGGGCYGWAPMGPRLTVTASFGWSAPMDWWIFIPQAQIYNRGFHSYYRGPRYNNTYINQTTIINNTYVNNRRTYVTGPRRQELERAGVRSIPTYRIRNERRPGATSVRRNEIGIYRPSIASTRGRNERPSRIASADRTRREGSAGVVRNDRAGIRERRTEANARSERIARTNRDAAARPDRMERRGSVQARPDVQQPAQRDRSEWNARRNAERQSRMNAPARQNERMATRPEYRERRADMSNTRNQQPAREMREQRMQQRQEINRTQRMQDQPRTAPSPRRMESSPRRMESRPQRMERPDNRPAQRMERAGGQQGFRR